MAGVGIRDSVIQSWYEVYRLAFSGLADLTGPAVNAGTMVLGTGARQATWTLRNTADAYVDSLNLASGKLVWNLNAANSTSSIQTAATGPILKTLLRNLWLAFGNAGAPTSAAPHIPVRCACAFTDVGDQNTEVIGMGIGLAGADIGHGYTVEAGFIGGAAKVQWSSYSPTKSTCPTPVAVAATALALEIHCSRCTPYYGAATAGGEPPDLVDADGAWTAAPGMELNAYTAANGADFLCPSNTLGNFLLLAATGNTNNNFAPAHTGIAVAVPRNFVMT